MSVVEGIVEYGKWYHQDCMIQKLGKEVEKYKKKWIDGKLSKGDKVELLDLYNLRENMKANRTEFNGLALKSETTLVRNMLTTEPLKQAIYIDKDGMVPVLAEDGKHIFTEDHAPTVVVKNAIRRPDVKKTGKPEQRRLITMSELPRLLGVSE